MDGSCCWLSPGMLAMPTMPYYVVVSGAKLPTVSDWSNTKTSMDRSGPAPTALHRADWPGGSGIGGAPAGGLLLLRNASATGLQQDVCLCV